MITSIPDFVEGKDWRELSPREGKRRYRFATLRPQSVTLDLPLTELVTFHDRHGREWARFDGPVFTLAADYWWNGNSPKRWVPLLGWVGTPDCRGDVTGVGGNIQASGFHDPWSQFMLTQHFPLSRGEVNLGFYDVNVCSGFPFALPYYSAVQSVGRAWPRSDNGEYSILHRP